MGRKKKIVEEKKEEILDEFMVEMRDPDNNGKQTFSLVKAKTKEDALKILAKEYKRDNLFFRVI